LQLIASSRLGLLGGFLERFTNRAIDRAKDDLGQVALETSRAYSKPPLGFIHGEGTSHGKGKPSSEEAQAVTDRYSGGAPPNNYFLVAAC
jgi:hypothetical protein